MLHNKNRSYIISWEKKELEGTYGLNPLTLECPIRDFGKAYNIHKDSDYQKIRTLIYRSY
jgi:hypothetical protein